MSTQNAQHTDAPNQNATPSPTDAPKQSATSSLSGEGFTVSYGFIAIASGMMLMGAWVLVTLVLQGIDPQDPHKSYSPPKAAPIPRIAAALPATPPLTNALLSATPGSSSRSLQRFYKQRAYSGSPPHIPHDILEYNGQMDACLSCHGQGGYVPKYNAFAPTTPHPTYINCVQCHVPQRTQSTFRPSAWKASPRPQLRRAALAGSPPPIPHDLHLRTDCNACHAGPAAVKEIRVPHPERSNCLQCHVPRKQVPLFRSLYPLHKRLEKSTSPHTLSPQRKSR